MKAIAFSGTVVADAKKITYENGEVAIFSIVLDGYYKGETFPEYYKCKVFGKKADIVADTYKKGCHVGVSGTFGYEPYKGSQGEDRQEFVVKVSDFDLPKKPKGEE